MKTHLLFIITIAFVHQVTFSQPTGNPFDSKRVSTLYDTYSVLKYSWHDSLKNSKPAQITHLEIPKTNPGEKIISHTGYSFLFSDKDKQSKWVAYELTREKTKKIYNRTNKFMPDPAVASGTATNSDYARSGYDKGHLAPAADMGWSLTSMAESFYYSNMSPQVPAFNRGIWKKLEELVRTWAIQNEAIYIVTGPVLTNGLPSIGPHKVSVPNYFYKVILDYTEPGINGIGFILPNAGSGESLQDFAVTIDSVEKLTGIDFFPSLPDEQEQKIEKIVCIPCWSWKNSAKEIKSDNTKKASNAVQYRGTTKSGGSYKNKTLNPSGYCYLHTARLTQHSTNSNTQPSLVKSE